MYKCVVCNQCMGGFKIPTRVAFMSNLTVYFEIQIMNGEESLLVIID